MFYRIRKFIFSVDPKPEKMSTPLLVLLLLPIAVQGLSALWRKYDASEDAATPYSNQHYRLEEAVLRCTVRPNSCATVCFETRREKTFLAQQEYLQENLNTVAGKYECFSQAPPGTGSITTTTTISIETTAALTTPSTTDVITTATIIVPAQSTESEDEEEEEDWKIN